MSCRAVNQICGLVPLVAAWRLSSRRFLCLNHLTKESGSLAQSAEQQPFKLQVQGSIPWRLIEIWQAGVPSLAFVKMSEELPDSRYHRKLIRDCLTKQQVRASAAQAAGNDNCNRKYSRAREPRAQGANRWGKSPPAPAAMTAARRMSNREQGRWAIAARQWSCRSAVIRFARIAYTAPKQRCFETDDGVKQNRGYDHLPSLICDC